MKSRARILVVCTTDSMIWNFLIPHIKNLEKAGYAVECACSVTGEFFEDLKQQFGFVMHRVSFSRSPYDPMNIGAYFQLKRIVKDRKIDIIFCHEPVGGAMGRLVGKKCNCKVVYMAHGFHFYEGAPKSSKIYYNVEKYLSKYTDILITINREDYNASLCFSAKANYLLPGIGVDTSKFICNREPGYIRKELGLDKDDVILLSVGELIARKNHEAVIRAVENLKNTHIHYIIAGDGELREYLQKKIDDCGLNNVHLLGYRKDISKLCNSSDIFVMPSYQEGLSVALMEAMACGMPIIASRIRGNVDLITDKENGLLVSVSDIEGYKRAITELVESRQKRMQMGQANKHRVKEFDIKPVEHELLKIINSLTS